MKTPDLVPLTPEDEKIRIQCGERVWVISFPEDGAAPTIEELPDPRSNSSTDQAGAEGGAGTAGSLDLDFDEVARTVTRKGSGQPTSLAGSQVLWDILKKLSMHKGRYCSSQYLAGHSCQDKVSTNTVASHIKRLRKKLKGKGLAIESRRHQGYRLVQERDSRQGPECG